jgi:hypothetical protein
MTWGPVAELKAGNGPGPHGKQENVGPSPLGGTWLAADAPNDPPSLARRTSVLPVPIATGTSSHSNTCRLATRAARTGQRGKAPPDQARTVEGPRHPSTSIFCLPIYCLWVDQWLEIWSSPKISFIGTRKLVPLTGYES